MPTPRLVLNLVVSGPRDTLPTSHIFESKRDMGMQFANGRFCVVNLSGRCVVD